MNFNSNVIMGLKIEPVVQVQRENDVFGDFSAEQNDALAKIR